MGSIARDRNEASAGFSLIEVMISCMVVSVALLASVGTLGTTMRMSRTVTEREAAQRAATGALQDIAATDFAKVLATFDANPANDPNGAGTAPGEFFAVPGLSPEAGTPASQAGRIVFPFVGSELRENAAMPELGMPRDLNGDGVVDGLDHSKDCVLLPVLVEIRWQGVDGRHSSLTMARLLSSR